MASGVLAGPTLILGAAPAQAAATGVYVKDGILEVRAGAATANRITLELISVGFAQLRYQVTDTGGTVVPGPGCSKVNANVARCTVGGVKSIQIRTFDGNDRIAIKGKIGTWVSAGEGNDYLDLSSGNDVAYGGPGDDQFYGWSGKDRMYGDAGNDTMYGHKDADTMYGADGTDRMYGGDGADTIHGQASLDWLYGENGNDTMYGAQGPDRMYGGAGKDRMLGETGHDVMTGGSDNDKVNGGNDNDIVTGDVGDDELAGGGGDDTLNGRDNRAANDELWGESGKDSCLIDPGDVTHTCES
ncbi:calcium-binding protein [Kocuria oceani]|uniref:Calcium-binding protein n=1 Tax=Kocuria oceani TaxID=988827 RepID=A0ABV9TJR9_9MICC|nr:calcium-binding protein [Kocuria oceani]